MGKVSGIELRRGVTFGSANVPLLQRGEKYTDLELGSKLRQVLCKAQFGVGIMIEQPEEETKAVKPKKNKAVKPAKNKSNG